LRLTPKTVKKHLGKMIRVDPGHDYHGSRSGNNKKQHKIPARLLRAHKGKALVRPRRHDKDEWVPLSACHTWVSGNHELPTF
jgi:hypothetical protein